MKMSNVIFILNLILVFTIVVGFFLLPKTWWVFIMLLAASLWSIWGFKLFNQYRSQGQ